MSNSTWNDSRKVYSLDNADIDHFRDALARMYMLKFKRHMPKFTDLELIAQWDDHTYLTDHDDEYINMSKGK